MEFKKMGAEFVGTAILVLGGVGVTVLGGTNVVGVLGIALAFGLIALALAYAIGPISGAHVNPAVTLAFVLSGRMKVLLGVQYWIAQILGGILGAALVVVVRTQVSGVSQKLTGADGWGTASLTKANVGAAFIVEILATFLFVFVVLAVTSRIGDAAFAGIPIGVALTVAYLVAIPVSGGGVNPARSLGPAIFAGGQALGQVWLYVVAPLLGAVLAVIVHALVTTERNQPVEDPEPVAVRKAVKSARPARAAGRR